LDFKFTRAEAARNAFNQSGKSPPHLLRAGGWDGGVAYQRARTSQAPYTERD